MDQGARRFLDRVYAEALGCSPEQLRGNGLVVVENDLRSIRFAKGEPLVLYSLGEAAGAVIAVKPELRAVAERAVTDLPQSASLLGEAFCRTVEKGVAPLIGNGCWFRGVRLFCTPDCFVDCSFGQVGELLPADLPAEAEWADVGGETRGTKIFAQWADGQVVSYAVVKPVLAGVWDLAVQTFSGYRRRGCAKSVVSAALKYIFAQGKLAGWGCERSNLASLGTARAVGFVHYAFDFGCVQMSAASCARRSRSQASYGVTPEEARP